MSDHDRSISPGIANQANVPHGDPRDSQQSGSLPPSSSQTGERGSERLISPTGETPNAALGTPAPASADPTSHAIDCSSEEQQSHVTPGEPDDGVSHATRNDTEGDEGIASGVSAACDVTSTTRSKKPFAPPTVKQLGEAQVRRRKHLETQNLGQISLNIKIAARDVIPDLCREFGSPGKPLGKGMTVSHVLLETAKRPWVFKAIEAFEPFAAARGTNARKLLLRFYRDLEEASSDEADTDCGDVA